MTLDSKSSILNIDCQVTFAPAGILFWVIKLCAQVGGTPTKEAVYSSDTLVATQVMANIFGDRARSNHMKGREICV
jgi:hypothetical protein